MKKLKAIADLFDCLIYIAVSVGIFVAAFNGSMIWVCVCGFILVDEGITMVVRNISKEEQNDGK